MRRRGFAKLELLVSAILLTTMIAVASPLFYRLNQVWQSTRWHQLASQELVNQMDRLMHLTRDECEVELAELKSSPEMDDAIPAGKLVGTIESPNQGERIVLSFHLPETVRSQPIVLVGWLRGGLSR